jgi:hypothetical protein
LLVNDQQGSPLQWTMPAIEAAGGAANVRLTAVLLMIRDYPSIARTVRHLLAQTAIDRLEVIIVTTPGKEPQVDRAVLARAAACQVVTIPHFDTAAHGWAAGVRRAQAPIAVLCEDHSFPEPQWAESLIAEHTGQWAAVAPMMYNGNPGTSVSWANFLLCFLEWFLPVHAGAVPSGPGHNTCYRRSALGPWEDSLETWFNPERVLHLEMQARGLKILQSQRAATHHVNISRPGSYLAHSFHGGRLFGGSRSAPWSKPKALLYACAFPLVPLVRLRRIFAHLNTPERRRRARLPSALPWIVAGLVSHAVGEAIGYVVGPGDANRKYMSFETERRQHLTFGEQAIFDAPPYPLASRAASD